MSVSVGESYRLCQQIARRTAKNFYYSFLVMPRAKREAMCAIYAFMRRSDDIADSAANPARALTGLQAWRQELRTALGAEGQTGADNAAPCSGQSESIDVDPILPALADTVRRYNIPHHHFYELLDGTEMDQDKFRYATFDELYAYCYRVASCVGLVVLPIFGYEDKRAEEYGEACGIAFQLTNILRDVKEDAALGRIYLPLEDLKRFGVTEDDIINNRATPQFEELMKFEAERAATYYRQAQPLLNLIQADSRKTLAVMMSIYGGILDKIVKNNYAVFSERMRLSAGEKWKIVMKSWMGVGM